MFRNCFLLVSALVSVSLTGSSRAAVTVFQNPANQPTEAPAASIAIGGPPVVLNLFYRQSGAATSAAGEVCRIGSGDEVCGWDVYVSTSAPGVVLSNFTPDTGPGPDYAIGAISGDVLRVNGGDPIVGETGVHRIGSVLATATTAGDVTVSGNIYVTAGLGPNGVTTGNILATGVVGADGDADGVIDVADNCPTVPNPLVAGVQPDGDGDGVGDACDNCTTVANPRVAAGFLTTNAWATLTGGQRDDDHDGFGNQCDGNFFGPDTELIGPSDLAQFRSASGKSRELDVCGTAPGSLTQPCAKFDLNGADTLIGPADLAIFRSLNGKLPGPKCAACTGTGSAALPCQAGAAGACN